MHKGFSLVKRFNIQTLNNIILYFFTGIVTFAYIIKKFFLGLEM